MYYMHLGVICRCETKHKPLHPQMVEDAQLRTAEWMIWHLGQVEKSFKLEKHKEARDLLLHQALEGGAGCMEAVHKFKEDPNVLRTFSDSPPPGQCVALQVQCVPGACSSTSDVVVQCSAPQLHYWDDKGGVGGGDEEEEAGKHPGCCYSG